MCVLFIGELTYLKWDGCMRVFDYTYIRKWLFGFKLYMVQYLKPIRAYRIYNFNLMNLPKNDLPSAMG